MLQQTNKFIVVLILFVAVIKLTNCQTYELGNDSNYNYTMKYLERQEDEALRLKFMVETPDLIARDKAHMVICCHTLPPSPAEESAPEESTSEEPTAEEPTTEEPTTEEPTTEEPTTEESAVEEPVPEQPVTEEPVPEQPATEEPVTEEPVPEQPATEEPVTEEPTTEEPAPEQPVTEEPVPEQPATEQPVTEQPVTEQPVTEEPVPEQPVPEQPTPEQPATEQPAVEAPTTEEPATEGPTPNESPAVPANGNRRRLAEEDLGKCFAMKFDCIGKTDCKDSLDATVSLYSSSLRDETNIFAAGGNDFSVGNFGVSSTGSSKEYNTRYKFNENDAKKTNIPLVGTNAHMTCYTAYNVSVSNSDLSKDQDLSDSKKFTGIKHIVFAVSDDSIKKESEANPEEVSGAFQSVVQISFLCAVLVMFTIF